MPEEPTSSLPKPTSALSSRPTRPPARTPCRLLEEGQRPQTLSLRGRGQGEGVLSRRVASKAEPPLHPLPTGERASLARSGGARRSVAVAAAGDPADAVAVAVAPYRPADAARVAAGVVMMSGRMMVVTARVGMALGFRRRGRQAVDAHRQDQGQGKLQYSHGLTPASSIGPSAPGPRCEAAQDALTNISGNFGGSGSPPPSLRAWLTRS
jgi:hypothetical protein